MSMTINLLWKSRGLFLCSFTNILEWTCTIWRLPAYYSVQIRSVKVKEEAKAVIKNILNMVLEIITILSVGWIFCFLVKKKIARMVKFVAIVCGIRQFIKMFV